MEFSGNFINNVHTMSLNVSGENSGTKGQTGTKEQGQRQGYSLPPYAENMLFLACFLQKIVTFFCVLIKMNLFVQIYS